MNRRIAIAKAVACHDSISRSSRLMVKAKFRGCHQRPYDLLARRYATIDAFLEVGLHSVGLFGCGEARQDTQKCLLDQIAIVLDARKPSRKPSRGQEFREGRTVRFKKRLA